MSKINPLDVGKLIFQHGNKAKKMFDVAKQNCKNPLNPTKEEIFLIAKKYGVNPKTLKAVAPKVLNSGVGKSLIKQFNVSNETINQALSSIDSLDTNNALGKSEAPTNTFAFPKNNFPKIK